MSEHVIKYDHMDGEKLIKPILWCGRESTEYDWYFMNAQHVALALSQGQFILPCKNCLKAIISELEKGLS